jgi:hypothetical protein
MGHMTQKVEFQIELDGNTTWDYGPITFTNVQIAAETTDTTWCTGGA